jgi:hypothetical protein
MTRYFTRRHPGLRHTLPLVLLLGLAPIVEAMQWPQQITADEGTIVVYQPQPETLKGNVLTGRAAMSLQDGSIEQPIFGAFWFESRISTDHDAGTVLIRDLKVTAVRWPESRDDQEQRFTAVVEAAVPQNGFTISLAALSSSLATADIERESLADIRNDPPEIIFRENLAVLLMYDGEPRYADVENSPYERVLNTPFAVVREKGTNRFWLSSGKFWYAASDPMGPWTPSDSPPADLEQAMQGAQTDGPQPDTPPEIVTADTPTELIVTQGKPDWQSLPGGQLLYVQNTESPWLRELSTNNMYLLLSGRWFRSRAQDGPWTFVPADELPPGFKDIPPASDLGGLRTSVAGTAEAMDATLDQHIPQTAAIRRDEATLSVEYDGEPQFEPVPGTDVSYAVNTGGQVLNVEGRYYAVDNGVWFTSASATGPWVVADSVPREQIDKIPPSSPVYNTTYVHVYDSTPDVVYVGYTPGYLWSFPYYGVPIYGTGWYYRPYYGRWYYPRPPTWGFHAGYNPWTGWNYGVSWSNGFFSFGVSWGGGWGGSYYRPWGCCGGWYGGGYRGPVIINTGDINIGNNVNVGNRVDIGNRIDRDTNINRDRSRNLYNRPENRARNADPATAMQQLREARPVDDRANDVFADRNGNVAKRVENGWQTRETGGWSRDTIPAGSGDRLDGMRPSDPATRPSTRPELPSSMPSTRPSTRPSTPSTRPSMPASRPSFDRAGLNQAYSARSRGAMRSGGGARPAQMPQRRR